MNVDIGTEAEQFPEKEYKMGFSLQCGWKGPYTGVDFIPQSDIYDFG